MKFSSSYISLAVKHCMKALDFADEGVDWVGPKLNVGITAHAVLQYVQEEVFKQGKELHPFEVCRIADEVVTELVTNGREFRGRKEPPIGIEDAYEGRDLAMRYIEAKGLEPHLLPERELEMKGYPYVALFDAHGVRDEGDEESTYTVAEAVDYKSAWTAGEATLQTLQIKGQAVILWDNYPEADVVRVKVANLRTLGEWSAEFYRHDDAHKEQIEQWRKDIIQTCEMAKGIRQASPGAGCIGCPYAYQCYDCFRFARDTGGTAAAWATAKARADSLAPIVRKMCKDDGVQTIANGTVGYQTRTRRRPRADAYATIASRCRRGSTGRRSMTRWHVCARPCAR